MKRILKIILCCIFAFLLIGCAENETGPDMDKVNEVISEIDSLPPKATTSDEEDVNFVLAMYEGLSAEEKALVTNKEKLDEALNCIDYYKQALVHFEIKDEFNSETYDYNILAKRTKSVLESEKQLTRKRR